MFAERGIAGARTDRIAAGACCDKALILHYFTSKDALVGSVWTSRERLRASCRSGRHRLSRRPVWVPLSAPGRCERRERTE
ncbi:MULTISPECIES: helix-turn-helix domain-containing protein [unclassified Streptomyces]|uniref:helix-turn-helix domain-containing protein n=1 Tax=unclassified Streptomyces TaxID=2593676 RepID=UPI00341A04F1